MNFIRDVYKGRTIGRILLNREIEKALSRLSGKVFDLGGSRKASYIPYIPKEVSLTVSDYDEAKEVDQVIDFNKPLPYEENTFDSVLLFNALYIAEDPVATLSEVHRVLTEGGQLILSSPFIANEMPEPHDYVRFTKEGLEKVLQSAGFKIITVERVGERGSAAAHLLHPFFLFNTVRLCAYILALACDKLVPIKVRREHPAPLGYVVRAKK